MNDSITQALISIAKQLSRSEQFPDGWITANEVWTYVSATTFTIPGDVTGKYMKGDKLKLDNTTTKYFYVISAVYGAPNTTITVYAGTDYTLANATISNNFYSRAQTPVNFPEVFAYTPTLTPAAGAYTTASATGRFSIHGRMVNYYGDITITTIGTGTGPRITVPVTAAATAGLAAVARADGVSGKLCQAKFGTTSRADFSNYDNTNPAASGEILRYNGWYEMA